MKKLTKIIAVTGIVAGLGVAALPIASHAAESASANVTVTLKVSDAISIAFVDPNPDHAGATISAANIDLGTLAPSTVTNFNDGSNKVTTLVKSNNLSGYTVTASGVSLTSGSNSIPYGAVTSGTSAYGMAKTNSGFTGLTEVDSKTAPSATDGDRTDLYFGASISASQPTGTYTGTVTITATNNN